MKQKRKGGNMKVKYKQLTFKIKSTSRKAREFERALRTFSDNYADKAGVYDLEVSEVNKVIIEK